MVPSQTPRTDSRQLDVFVLVCMIDAAEAEDKPYMFNVAYLDLKNAFPHTDRPILWVKLAKLGTCGSMIEWLKRLYDRIQYIVRQDAYF